MTVSSPGDASEREAAEAARGVGNASGGGATDPVARQAEDDELQLSPPRDRPGDEEVLRMYRHHGRQSECGEWRGVANGFGGHAWTQAYVGGKWLGLDAAFRGSGLGGYDAGPIALAAGKGDPGPFVSLCTPMGHVQLASAIHQMK